MVVEEVGGFEARSRRDQAKHSLSPDIRRLSRIRIGKRSASKFAACAGASPTDLRGQ
jgi:hypothetical protein